MDGMEVQENEAVEEDARKEEGGTHRLHRCVYVKRGGNTQHHGSTVSVIVVVVVGDIARWLLCDGMVLAISVMVVAAQ